ncbi:thiamine phosphate synthase [Iodidimonas sp. SYSU 1G8]|uniref:thiamine phosphate synthase n=1 Tax=Iodidimonas sp. SYSU 1G8 TaxID=3133967 RepID=UPI0031FEDA18
MASTKLISLWRAASALHRRAGGDDGLPPLWFMTDARRVPDPIAAAGALPRGAGVILRDYDAPGRADLATRLVRLSRKRGLLVLVAGDVSLAEAVGADGVHLPQWLIPRAGMIRRRHPRWLLTAAAHDRKALRRAASAGAHAAFVSPVFSTASHPGAPYLGPAKLSALVRGSGIPVYALGGVDTESVRRLRGMGVAGVGVIGAVAEGLSD